MKKNEKPAPKKLIKFPKDGKQPVVFTFRPTEYAMVPPERFKEWQENMITFVGLPRKVVERMKYTGGEIDTFSNGVLDD